MNQDPAELARLKRIEEEKAKFLKVFNHMNRDPEGLIAKSLDSYHLSFDVRSLRMFYRGFTLRGTRSADTTIETKVAPKKVIAVVGEFKIGKTWLLERLLELSLLSGFTNQTMGLGVNFLPAGAGKKAYLANFTCLDTPGNNLPVHEALRPDMRATEIFMRDLSLHLSSEVIAVFGRYDGDAQETVRVMVEFVRQTTNMPNRKLIVVHNIREATLPSILLFRIQALKQTFVDDDELNVALVDPETVMISRAEVKDDSYDAFRRMEIEERKASLVGQDYDLDDPALQFDPAADIELPIEFFDNSRYTHVFVVNDSTEWGKSYNNRVFTALRSRLIMNNTPRSINYMKEVQSFVQRHLPTYIEGLMEADFSTVWDQDGDGNKVLYPLINGQRVEEVLPLRRLAFVTGGRVVSESDDILRGDITLDEKQQQYIVEVEAPGVESIELCDFHVRHDKLALRVKVDFAPLYVDRSAPLVSTRPHRTGIFASDFSQVDPEGLFLPPPAGKKWRDLASLKAGTVTLTIARGSRGN